MVETTEGQQAYTDNPNVHHFGRVRADEMPVPFYSFTLLRATDADGQAHIFWVPTEALRSTSRDSEVRPPYEDVRAAIRTVLERRRAIVSIPDGTLAWDAFAADVWGELPSRDSEVRADGDAYEVRTWVRHEPSGVVVLKGHPQLGGRYCKTDGGDWPCAAVRAAIGEEAHRG